LVLFLLAVLLLILVFLLSLLLTFVWGAPWSPTPMRTVRRMLEMAGVKRGERVYDLGSGDGRIALVASADFGAKSVGIEINPFLHFMSKIRKAILHIGDEALLMRGNFFKASVEDADVVAVYLSPWGNRKLKKKLERELRPGARVITYKWKFEGWKPVDADERYRIWLYRVGGG